MLPITGRMIFEGPMGERVRSIIGMGFGLELFYAFVIILCSLMIYFGTKELYDLSLYKGIKYFRQAFLFFAIAYFFRSFIKFIVLYFNFNGIIEFSPVLFGATGQLTQLLFMYFSSMAIFYLLYSVMWRRWNKGSNTLYLLHILAGGISLISLVYQSPLLYLLINLFLLMIVLFVVYASYNDKENKSKGRGLYWIYILLSIFWAFNIIDALLPRFFQGFQLVIYLASAGIFLTILYKVIKRVGSA